MIENYDIQNLGPGLGDEVHRLPDSVLHRFTIYVPPVTRDFFLGRGVKRTETIDGRRPEEAAAESRAFIPSESGGLTKIQTCEP